MKIPTELEITETEVLAVRACMAGVANDDQQKIAMQFIGAKLCGLFEPEMVPGEQPLASAHNSGRRWVGLMLSIMKEPEMLAHARKKRTTKRQPT